jgi:pimeloyl-ACP methyl ester carboxylesterase
VPAVQLLLLGLLAALVVSPVSATSPAPTAGLLAAAKPPTCMGVDLAAAPLPANPDRNPDGTPVTITANRSGGRTPVVVVHGWTGRATHNVDRTGAFSHLIDLTANRLGTVNVSRSVIGQIQRLGGTAVYTFDYHGISTRWVTDDGIGPRLGRAIDCLYEATGQRVIIVAHSMGGLAARQAITADRASRVS